MPEIESFDLINSPLQGTNLIEASAGTGKTYTIAGLVLRLIVEQGLAINEILSVTFTVAATEELRHRIRQTLKAAEGAFTRGHSDDPFLQAIVRKFTDHGDKAQRLREALRDFDEAAIFTIHGFCQKILQTHTFETGSLFDTELLTDEAVLKQEIVDDFWRKHFFRGSPLFVNYALSKKDKKEAWTLELLMQLFSAPWATVETNILPPIDLVDLSDLEERYRVVVHGLSDAWLSARGEVEEMLTSYPHLSRAKYKVSKIPELIEAMDEFVTLQGNAPDRFIALDSFAKSAIQAGTNKSGPPPDHPFFDYAEAVKQQKDALCEAYDRQLLGLKFAALEYLRHEIGVRKRKHNLQSYNDLLVQVRDVLAGEMGARLAVEMRRTYRAALIDEFQDTDPIQYAVFNHVFSEGAVMLFLIGDPKQAIYGFRGADIFTYFKATESVDRRYTLENNWRSEVDLVTAANTVFSRSGAPFVYEEIPFRPVQAAERKEAPVLTIDGKREAPFRSWFVDRRACGLDPPKGQQRAISKGVAQEVINRAVAEEIVRLLQCAREGTALLGHDPVEAGDIAILVQTNREARDMHRMLTAYTIPSVLYVTEDLFDSREAHELDRILRAVTVPHNDRLVGAALTTSIIGLTGEDLEAAKASERVWEQWIRKFNRLQDLWKSRGFIVMLHYLINEEHVRTRLLSFPDGERRLTNVLHLGEVLHQASLEQELTMSGLIQWLSKQRNDSSLRLEEHQLRLESDANAVNVVTIHKSKGLEFPIVFCPFNWSASRLGRSNSPLVFHETSEERRRWIDLAGGTEPSHCILAEREALAEKMRLFYVAVTRAKNRCYTVWGNFNKAGTSAMAYCLQAPEVKADAADVVESLEAFYKELDDDAVRKALDELARDGKNSVAVERIPIGNGASLSVPQEETTALECRSFGGFIDRTWRISSFSSVTAFFDHSEQERYQELADAPDHDEETRRLEPTVAEPSGIFAFPQGAQAGLAIHELFEDLDFTEKQPDAIKGLAVEKLRRYGFDPCWDQTLHDMTVNVLSTPLSGGGLTLDSITTANRISELEFYYPVKEISPQRLEALFRVYGGIDVTDRFPQRIEGLSFYPARGFMKGFIDLVFQHEDLFYLVDWKSNFLGNSVEHYTEALLAEVMEEQFYTLQYHIYTLALHQYLRLRRPGYEYAKHFGGICYIFVRGVDPKKGLDYGIYRARPAEELIEAMAREIIGDR